MMRDEDLHRLLALEREDALDRARQELLGFTLWTMPEYQVNWHHRLLCRALNRLARGEILRLIITTPPRCGKSELVSRRFPAFLLGQNPDMEIMSASYSAVLAERMNRDVQRIMSTPQYKEVFPHTQLKETIDGKVTGYLQNSQIFEVVGHKGRFQCAGVGGSLTGGGADAAIVDDPLRNWQDASSRLIRDRQWEWYASVLYTRLSQKGRVCITMTRWHEKDLVGRLLDQIAKDVDGEPWEVINLPAIRDTVEGHPEDHRAIGEALWPARFPIKRLEATRKNSERIFVSMYQGRPSPPEGNIVKRAWWKFYRPSELPKTLSHKALSLDLTFKDREKDDWVVMQLWGRHQANFYLLHQVRCKAGFTEQKALFEALVSANPDAIAKWVEAAANGHALIDALSKVIPGIIPVTPRGSKVARAESCALFIEAGNVYLPHPDTCSWVEGFIDEWATFPAGAHDDQVDACSQALNQYANGAGMDLMIFGETKKSLW